MQDGGIGDEIEVKRASERGLKIRGGEGRFTIANHRAIRQGLPSLPTPRVLHCDTCIITRKKHLCAHKDNGGPRLHHSI